MGNYSAPRKPDTILGRPQFGYRQPDTDRMDRLPPNVDPRMLEFDPRVYNPSFFDPNIRSNVNTQQTVQPFPGRVINPRAIDFFDIKGAASDIPYLAGQAPPQTATSILSMLASLAGSVALSALGTAAKVSGDRQQTNAEAASSNYNAPLVV